MPKHVLLLDDDPTQLKIRETILRSAGILVSIATTPESALALMRSQLGQHGDSRTRLERHGRDRRGISRDERRDPAEAFTP